MPCVRDCQNNAPPKYCCRCTPNDFNALSSVLTIKGPFPFSLVLCIWPHFCFLTWIHLCILDNDLQVPSWFLFFFSAHCFSRSTARRFFSSLTKATYGYLVQHFLWMLSGFKVFYIPEKRVQCSSSFLICWFCWVMVSFKHYMSIMMHHFRMI